jgi:hypothetical protein
LEAYSHFIHGTRRGDVGKRLTPRAFTDAVGVNERTVRYWLRDEHLPKNTFAIEDRLFGYDFSTCTAGRFQLREALAQSRSKQRGVGAGSYFTDYSPSETLVTSHRFNGTS